VTTQISRAGLNGASPPDRPVTWPGSNIFVQINLLTRRLLYAWATEPSAVIIGLIQPMLFLFLLTGVFSKVQITGDLPPGITYFDFVLPAILVDNAMQTAMQCGVGLIDDMKNGIVARLRSMPIQPSSLLVARSFTNLVRSVLQVVVILALAGLVLGQYPQSGFLKVSVAVGLTLLMGWSMGWVFLAASAWFRNAEAFQSLATLIVFPLMFASSAYVPVSQLPGYLAFVARINPLTYAINSTRALSLNTPGALDKALPTILLSVVIAIVGSVLAVLGFRRPG
jgi:ABC-2 type transport system permease protein